jgi:phosphoribosyl 1,2-cyclic phosphodiesterase
MMVFKTHYSSSRGNLYEVRAANGRRLLIECGMTWDKTQEALDYDLRGIEGCLISHEHKDHCKAVYKVMRAGIKVYASAGTFEAMKVSLGRLTRVVADNVIVDTPTFSILSFQIKHDAAEPMGFVVQDKEAETYLLFMTDTDVFRHAFPYSFSIIALGCNFDPEIESCVITRQQRQLRYIWRDHAI